MIACKQVACRGGVFEESENLLHDMPIFKELHLMAQAITPDSVKFFFRLQNAQGDSYAMMDIVELKSDSGSILMQALDEAQGQGTKNDESISYPIGIEGPLIAFTSPFGAPPITICVMRGCIRGYGLRSLA